jgi:hypothetical protein
MKSIDPFILGSFTIDENATFPRRFRKWVWIGKIKIKIVESAFPTLIAPKKPHNSRDKTSLLGMYAKEKRIRVTCVRIGSQQA